MASMELSDLYQKHYLPVLKKAFRDAAGLTPETVRDELRYCKLVADPAWASLPLPLRKAGREKVRWDLFLLAARKEVFLIHEGAVTVRGDADERLLKLIGQMFGTTAAPASKPLPKTKVVAKPGPVATAATKQVAVGIDLGTTYSVV